MEEQISKSSEVMKQVDQAVGKFKPFAALCRRIFILLEALRDLSFLYKFPAKKFKTILEHVLKEQSETESASEDQRIESLKEGLFREVAARISQGVQVDDNKVFAILLARLKKGDVPVDSVNVTTDIVTLITNSFRDHFPWGRALNDLAIVVEADIGLIIPLLLRSAPGHDVSGRVESMARELDKRLSSVAMGSSEGFTTADSLLAAATKRGDWVMLKNVHLCTEWLRENLVKKLQALNSSTHKDFRIFTTSEINPRLPTAVLRISDVIVADNPTGLKSSIVRFFSSISKDHFRFPVRNRLYLLLGWLHAEKYEFTGADAAHALDVIDSLVEGSGRDQLDPEKLPWDAIRPTLCKGVFGGRITVPEDQRVLDGFVSFLFTPRSFDVELKLVDQRIL